jgi:hypothetical protein
VKSYNLRLTLLSAFCALTLISQIANSQEKSVSKTVPVHLVITDGALREHKELPPLQKEDEKIKQGKNVSVRASTPFDMSAVETNPNKPSKQGIGRPKGLSRAQADKREWRILLPVLAMRSGLL